MEQPEGSTAKKSTKKRWLSSLVLLIALGILGFGIGIWLSSFKSPGIEVPLAVSQKIDFPTYLPSKLPKNYKINNASFTIDEGTLVFSATDGVGGQITFSEQRRPSDFNFESFYKDEIKGARAINNAPFPSVGGVNKISENEIISVVTDDVWIIVTSSIPLGDELHDIARHIQRQ